MASKKLVKIFQNIGSRFAFFFLLRLNGFVVLPLWTAVIPPSQLALLGMLGTLPKLITTFSSLGYEIIINKVLFRFPLKKCYKYIITFCLVRFSVSLVLIFLLIAIFPLVNNRIFHGQVSFSAWFIMLCVGCLRIFIGSYLSVVQKKLYAREFFIINFIQTIVQSWSFVFLAYFVFRNYLASVYSVLAVNVILLIYSGIRFYFPIMKIRYVKPRLIIRYLFPSVPNYLAGTLNWAKSSFDSIIFGWLGSFSELGILNMGKTLAAPYDSLQRSVRQPAEFIFARDFERDNDANRIAEMSHLFFISMFSCILCYDEAIRWYVNTFVQSDYKDSLKLLLFVLVWFFVRDLQVFLFRIALRNNNFAFSSIVTSTISIANMIACVVFIPLYGLKGAVYSLILPEALIGAMGSLYVLRKYSFDFFTFYKIIFSLVVLMLLVCIQDITLLRIGIKLILLTTFVFLFIVKRNQYFPCTLRLVKQLVSR